MPLYGAQDGDDLDDEERERVARAENDRQERMRQAYLKEQEETELKNQKKAQAREQLSKWQEERKKQVANQVKNNKDNQAAYYEEQKRLKETTNQWERIISNVELNASNYVGDADVGRMRQAMIARKGDITKTGQQKKTL